MLKSELSNKVSALQHLQSSLWSSLSQALYSLKWHALVQLTDLKLKETFQHGTANHQDRQPLQVSLLCKLPLALLWTVIHLLL